MRGKVERAPITLLLADDARPPVTSLTFWIGAGRVGVAPVVDFVRGALQRLTAALSPAISLLKG